MADGRSHRGDVERPGTITVDVEKREVRVPIPSGTEVIVDPRERRDDVVRRLLDLGVAPETLMTVLPDWHALIRRVASAVCPGAERSRPV